MRYTVTATTVHGEASVRSKGAVVPFDGSATQGDTLPGPADLFAAAFARIVRLRYTLTITTDEPADHCELLHRNIRKFGTIFNTVAAACDVSGELVAERAAGSTLAPNEPPRSDT